MRKHEAREEGGTSVSTYVAGFAVGVLMTLLVERRAPWYAYVGLVLLALLAEFAVTLVHGFVRGVRRYRRDGA